MNNDLRLNQTHLRPSQLLACPSDQEAFSLDNDLTHQSAILPRVATTSSTKQHGRLLTLWRRHICMVVSHNSCRDHLANERTFLGYVRSGQAFAMLGVIIAQLMKLDHSENPDPVLGFYVISVPLACICYFLAFFITLVGCIRFLHWQEAMAMGRAISSGWEVLVTFFLSVATLTSILILTVAILIRND